MNTGIPTSTILVYSYLYKWNIWFKLNLIFEEWMLTLFVESAKRINYKACERDWERNEETAWCTKRWIWGNNQKAFIIYRSGKYGFYISLFHLSLYY